MQAAADFAVSQGGTAVIEEVPSYLAFFNKYVPNAEAVRRPSASLLPRTYQNNRAWAQRSHSARG